LIHSANKSQSEADVKLIKILVQEYIANERTIILAVISAKNDYANQVILERCRAVDPKGSRTLGIITKPDFLRAGSENERSWLELAQNKDVFFELGWHMLKNRAEDQMQLTFAERNAMEKSFFASGSYKELPGHLIGIDRLRTRLSKLLYKHLKREIPALKMELDSLMASTSKDLVLLGQKRSSIQEQKFYMTKMFMEGHKILDTAVRGIYEGNFFIPIISKAAVHEKTNVRRFRAVIQQMNLDFAQAMRQRGHKFAIGKAKKNKEPDDSDEEMTSANEASETEEFADAEQSSGAMVSRPISVTRSEAMDWVLGILRRSRGRELPGTFNPHVISQLFWEQSEGWKALAKDHIDRVAESCQIFVHQALDEVASSDVKANLVSLTIGHSLHNAHKNALDELDKIDEDKKRHPITYNHYFTLTMQKMQRKKYKSQLKTAADEAAVMRSEGGYTRRFVDPNKLQTCMDRHLELDMDKFSADHALDMQAAFYKVFSIIR
jgi:hypothetical protein